MDKFIYILIFLVFSCSVYAQKTNIEKSGDIIQIALPSIAFTSCFLKKQAKAKEFIVSMGTSFILTHSLKRTINKVRPNGSDYSFPSGHTSAAFTGAAFIDKNYGLKYGIPAYLLASYVGWSRVYANKHDYADVIGGAVIGIGSNYLLINLLNEKININTSYYKDARVIITLNI